MTGLLRKDLYYVKAYAWPYLPLLALLCLSPGAMGPAYAMALALALPRMTIANDERRWDRYAVMTPLRAELVVAEKGPVLREGLRMAIPAPAGAPVPVAGGDGSGLRHGPGAGPAPDDHRQ